ncbi:hypothetical protein Ae168Ps1_6397c [Pseudonocardia sp. Ae168_Ps1]|uniref:hypothetical protein n=1 Tax=unclassified Pseudonocardia TaxID=2619320 RepID=UPI00094B6FA0|nr:MULTISPECIES: hypothetical protein [unclassified Pseudonocardia]OLL69840.1 hypothetical protein Ae150APs1_6251c [Pseudonocardia sp. Ae150A_Ps1]OLL69972.1 hypothetical protein Ae168Ps1_6397c [Pseudonocardia sp. Ae168_Ps1]OLL89132.1 hypothetical protein Ae356Ps1_6249c [Pseudonocardia sp. Ae356_Ps1]
MAVHQRKLKLIAFDIDGATYECQIKTWKLENNTDEGDKQYSFCSDGEFREDSDPDWSLQFEYYSDWRSGGLSDVLMLAQGRTVDFTIDHHPDIPDEHVRWSGRCTVKAPSIGGEVRTTETQEAEFPVIGQPAYSRP